MMGVRSSASGARKVNGQKCLTRWFNAILHLNNVKKYVQIIQNVILLKLLGVEIVEVIIHQNVQKTVLIFMGEEHVCPKMEAREVQITEWPVAVE